MLNTDRLCMGCMNDNSGQSVCPVCGYDSSDNNARDKLPVKFVLKDRYIIGKVLLSNTESTTYIAFDSTENCAVTVREYLPVGIAVRLPDKTVGIATDKGFAFNEGLLQFSELAEKLMSLDLPCVNPVADVFEENGTVYSVSSMLSGITLEEFLKRNGGALRWEQARSLILPLMDTVKALHDVGIIHGAISPETVIVCRDGKLKLTDIAINGARRCDSEFAPSFHDGYAAPEQYGIEGITIGTYTDVYGLCATLFRVLIGVVPPAADERMKNDVLTVPAKFANELPRQVLMSLANGLQLMPSARTPGIEDFKNELVYGESARTREKVATTTVAQGNAEHGKKQMSTGKSVAVSAAITAAICIVITLAVLWAAGVFDKDSNTNRPVNSDTSEMPSTDNIGDFDPDAVKEQIKTYGVSDYRGKTLAEVLDDEANENFKFVIKGDEHSDKYAKGVIIKQSVSAGTVVEKKETVIELIVSSGPEKVKMKSVVGYTKDEAILALVKQGFVYDSIEIIGKYDPNATPGVIIEQEIKSGTTVSIYERIVLYFNEYDGEDEPEDYDEYGY